jgi:hypothetical protein
VGRGEIVGGNGEGDELIFWPSVELTEKDKL